MKSCHSAGQACYSGRLTTIATLVALCITRPGIVGATTIDAGTTTTVDGTGALPTWSVADSLYVDGAINVINGGVVGNTAAYLGFNSGTSGSGDISGAGSAWNSSDRLFVGYRGDGSLTISDGATVTNNSMGYIGYSSGVSGSVDVTGAGSVWNNNSILYVGNDGEANLTISNGAMVTDTTGYIGNGVNSSGTVEVTGAGSAWNHSAALYVGNYGEGTLTISDGATVSNTVGNVGVYGAGTVNVVGAGSSWNNLGLVVGSRGEGNLSIRDGGTVNSTRVSIGSSGGTGTVEVTGVGSSLVVNTGVSDEGDLLVGGTNSGNGSMTISDGATVSSIYGYVGYGDDASGTVTVTGAGSAWNNSDSLSVGVWGNGSLTISDSATVNSATGHVGEYSGFMGSPGSSGAVEVTGTGSAWNNVGALYVGEGGEGSLTISNGATVNNTAGYIGYSSDESGVNAIGDGWYTPAGTGTVLVTGTGSSWNNSKTLSVGDGGEGSLTISDSATVSNTHGYIGKEVGANGTVTVTDTGSTWNNSGGLYVGYSGTGSLTISDGAVVSNTNGYIGDGSVGAVDMAGNTDATGTVEVTGAGSHWNNSGDLNVGRFGNGTLTINDGGTVTSNSGYIGYGIGSSGTAEVIGAGSGWTTTGSLSVGYNGEGNLTIRDGASVSNTTGIIGYRAGSTGTAEVTGAGSNWNNNALYIGNVGDGSLTISDSATVSATNVTIAASADSAGTLNIGAAQGQTAVSAGQLATDTVAFGAGNGSVVFNHTDSAYLFDSDISGTNTDSTVNVLSGTTILTGVNTYAGQTLISGGSLQAGAADTLSASSAHTVSSGGMLDLNGYSNTVAGLDNAGIVRLSSAASASAIGATLTVMGDYVGNGGILALRTVLGDDDSATDRMVVNGSTSGTTTVQVLNAGGSGALTTDGIELISVSGGSDGEFKQDGRIVAGAYDYNLLRGSGQNASNWYLSSTLAPEDPVEPTPVEPEEPTTPTDPETPTPVEPSEPSEPDEPGISTPVTAPLVRPEAGLYGMNLYAANTMFTHRLHDRLGETHYVDALTGEKAVTSLWMRNTGGHTRAHDGSGQLDMQSNRYVLQLGGDVAQWSSDDRDRFHLGIMAGYANQKSRSHSNVTGYRADASIDGYSVGVYGTWLQNNDTKEGAYVDTWVLYNWFDNTVSGESISTEKYKSKGFTGSVEAGYTWKLADISERNALYIQPKAQATWMGVKADSHTESNGTRVEGTGDGNLQTRLGVRLYGHGHNKIDDGKSRTFQPFVEANWVHNTKSFGATLNGERVEMAGTRNVGEVKVGVEGKITPRLAVWGNVAQQLGDRGYSDTQGVVGVKYSW